MDLYQTFYLTNTAKCFTKCRQSKDKSCDLGNLQRYWVDYETHLVEESLTETVDLSFLKTSVKNFSTNISEDVHFSLIPSQLPMQVTEDEHKPADRVRLPRSLFTTLQGSRAAVRLAISVLDIGPGHLFKGPQLGLEDSGSVLNNRLVGLSLGRMRVTGLAEPLEITFSHQPQPPNMTLTCVFWDVAKGDWSSEGCSTEPGAKQTVCHCDHLTFFALLLRPVLDKVTAQTLTRISQAGCGTSMIFLAFTIILYTALRCWFQEETAISALYVTVHGYFLLTFLFSAVVLGLVAWKIFTLSSATAGKKERQNWKGALTLLGLSSLVGMTWGLAILTPLGLSTVYIFALFNSLQGVFIFCWFVMLYFPIQSAMSSSSGPAQAEHSHTVSHG
ncbi:adhesion G protein-coupled receptor G3 [Pteropus alecto]|uniref:adhesion G protein-coupled receptor G3 n=1 Tax=Pteropus alecto TaxID=9402 RepID=UPI00076880BB|nr:adhesion G protein-coupled receptor G3 [Pteropus alecto]